MLDVLDGVQRHPDTQRSARLYTLSDNSLQGTHSSLSSSVTDNSAANAALAATQAQITAQQMVTAQFLSASFVCGGSSTATAAPVTNPPLARAHILHPTSLS